MLGHNVWMIQWLTFVIASFWGSIAGLLYIYYNLFMSPHAISLQQSAEALLMAILGGASTLLGPIVGAAIITHREERGERPTSSAGTSLLGVIFVVVIMFMPNGLVPGCRQLWRSIQNRRKGRTPQLRPHRSPPHDRARARGRLRSTSASAACRRPRTSRSR